MGEFCNGKDCLVSVYLLRYKGSVYITILLVGTLKGVRNSREFAITVFDLTLIFSYHFKGNLPGIPNNFAISMKDLGHFIIQTCPTYNDERCSRRMIIKINIYCQYIMLTI